MTAKVRIVRADPQRLLATDRLVWFEESTGEGADDVLEGVPPDQRFAAELVDDPLHESSAGQGSDAVYAGIYGVRPLVLTVPGGPHGVRRVRAAGLTWVGVHPDRRRRGVLTAMLRDHLDRTLADGTAVSVLHASEVGIYGRYGYGAAVSAHLVTLARGTQVRAGHLDLAAARLDTVLATITDPGMEQRLRALDATVAETEVGTTVMEPGFYRRIVREPAERARGSEPARVLFARQDGRDVGAAVLRRRQRWERGRPHGELTVQYLVGSPPARLALLRRLVDFDLIAEVRLLGVGVDDPLWHWIGGPRGASAVETTDNLWVRLVDLPSAMAARGYAEDCDVVVEVADEYLPGNAGRWRIRVGAGQAHVERVATVADITLDVAALGAAWMGAAGNLTSMYRAGLLAQARPGAVRELWRALRTDVAPNAAPIF